jgi:hypothetical protein
MGHSMHLAHDQRTAITRKDLRVAIQKRVVRLAAFLLPEIDASASGNGRSGGGPCDAVVHSAYTTRLVTGLPVM